MIGRGQVARYWKLDGCKVAYVGRPAAIIVRFMNPDGTTKPVWIPRAALFNRSPHIGDENIAVRWWIIQDKKLPYINKVAQLIRV